MSKEIFCSIGVDVDGLREQLNRFPSLVAARGTNGNDLLGMATATCDERLVALLLKRGADPARANVHGWTPLHQAAYSDLPLLVVPDGGAAHFAQIVLAHVFPALDQFNSSRAAAARQSKATISDLL